MRGTSGVMAMLAAFALMAASAEAVPTTSITLDGSLGTSGAVTPTSGVYNILPSMGKTVSANGTENIFQSFGVFNLGTGDTADFVANAGTANIIARVTGGSTSNVDGTITSTVGAGGSVSTANLFFINPAGIMFTSHASLNLGGAFVASTANYVTLSDGKTFYADTQHAINDDGLSSAPVSAFGFMPAANQAPAPISFEGTQFTNAGGIHVIGGNLTLDQATTLLAPGGNLTLFSAASPGNVMFSLGSPGSGFASATNASFGSITIQNQSKVAIDSPNGGGSVVIRGGQLMVNNATVSSADTGSSIGGNISLQADQLEVEDGGQITATNNNEINGGLAGEVSVQAAGLVAVTNGSASGQDLTVNAQTLTMDGGSLNANANATFDVTGAMNLSAGAEISAGEVLGGTHGYILIEAGSLSLDGGGSNPPNGDLNGQTGIAAYGAYNYETAPDGVDITNTGPVSVTNGALIVTGGSNLTVEAASLYMNNNAQMSGEDGYREAGNLLFDIAGAIDLAGGSTISVLGENDNDLPVLQSGNPGITIYARSLDVHGYDSSGSPSGIFTADGGGIYNSNPPLDIDVTGNLSLSSGGYLSTSNGNDPNDGGNVTIVAGSVDMDGEHPKGLPGSLITASSQYNSTFEESDGGFVEFTLSHNLELSNGAAITSSSVIDDGGPITVSAGGSVKILTGSLISASSQEADAGDITITAVNFNLETGGELNTSAATNGGSISLNVQDIAYLFHGVIQASANLVSGVGGNILIDPQAVVLDDSLISAAGGAQNGNIEIITDNLLEEDTTITATGAIALSAPVLDLGGSLRSLPQELVNDSDRLKESCARSVGHEYSSLVVVGRGGTELAPDELQADFGIGARVGDVAR